MTVGNEASAPRVGVVMGSRSDWETMEHASAMLSRLGVVHEVRVVSAHRTPDLLFDYAATARDRGIQVVIAGAGGAAHLPGMIAAKTPLPVFGVPVQSKALNGMDSLLSIAQMPAGIPVASAVSSETTTSTRNACSRTLMTRNRMRATATAAMPSSGPAPSVWVQSSMKDLR